MPFFKSHRSRGTADFFQPFPDLRDAVVRQSIEGHFHSGIYGSASPDFSQDAGSLIKWTEPVRLPQIQGHGKKEFLSEQSSGKWSEVQGHFEPKTPKSGTNN
jgi:hypothetical protein